MGREKEKRKANLSKITATLERLYQPNEEDAI